MGCATSNVTAKLNGRIRRFMFFPTWYEQERGIGFSNLVLRGGLRSGRRLRRPRVRRSLPDLFEVLLHELLVNQRYLVAVDLATGFDMRSLLLRPRRLELLLARTDLHHHFAGDLSRPLADDLADLAHRRQLLGLARGLVAIRRADSALRILIRALVRRFLIAARFGGLLLVAVALLLVALRVRIGALALAGRLLALLARLILLAALLPVLRALRLL